MRQSEALTGASLTLLHIKHRYELIQEILFIHGKQVGEPDPFSCIAKKIS
jgi:hypothetical protein